MSLIMAQNVELFLLTRATAFILMFLRPKNDRECLMLVPTQNIYSTPHSRRPPLPPQGPVAFSRRPRPVQHPAPVTSEFLKMLKFSFWSLTSPFSPSQSPPAPPPPRLRQSKTMSDPFLPLSPMHCSKYQSLNSWMNSDFI